MMQISLTGRATPEPVSLPFDAAALRAMQRAAIGRHAATQPPITAILPVPRRVDFGGRSLLVGELRLADLAELQAWIEAEGHPLAGFDPAAPEPQRTARLREAWAASAAWPPRFGSAEGSRRLATLGGRSLVVRLVTRRHQPALTDDDVAAAVARATPGEWLALARVAWGITPRAELVGYVEPDAAPGPGIDWRLAICRTVEARNWTFREVGELTIGQWVALGSGGKSAGDPAGEARLRRARAALDPGGAVDAG